MKFEDMVTKLENMNEQNLKIDSAPDLDLLDYHWFLVSLMDTIDNNYQLEILNNNTSDYKYYKVYSGEVDNIKLNSIQLTVSDVNNHQIKETLSFEVNKVDDARIVEGYKYHVITPQGKYRFLMCGRADSNK